MNIKQHEDKLRQASIDARKAADSNWQKIMLDATHGLYNREMIVDAMTWCNTQDYIENKQKLNGHLHERKKYIEMEDGKMDWLSKSVVG